MTAAGDTSEIADYSRRPSWLTGWQSDAQIIPLRKPTTSDSGYGLRVADGTFTDMAAKVKEQNLAVFGLGGSGKTVLLSSFYGASQEQSFLTKNLYQVLADDTGQHMRLLQNYLRMRNQAEPRRATASPRPPTPSR
jgi:hypothetical protein